MSCTGYFISLHPDSLPCKRVIKIPACWVFVQWPEMTQCLANCRCSDHRTVRSPRQLPARCPGVLRASKFSPEGDSSLLRIPSQLCVPQTWKLWSVHSPGTTWARWAYTTENYPGKHKSSVKTLPSCSWVWQSLFPWPCLGAESRILPNLLTTL